MKNFEILSKSQIIFGGLIIFILGMLVGSANFETNFSMSNENINFDIKPRIK